MWCGVFFNLSRMSGSVYSSLSQINNPLSFYDKLLMIFDMIREIYVGYYPQSHIDK